MHETNRQCWDDLSSHWKELRNRDNLWQRIPHEPDLAFEGGALDLIHTACDNLEGKDVCVIGSGGFAHSMPDSSESWARSLDALDALLRNWPTQATTTTDSTTRWESS